MEMTGWISGQVFFQTVDQGEVEQINAFLNSRGIISQVLTQSEHMMLDPADPSVGVTSERFSMAIQLGGFPQVIGPVLNELIQRAHAAAGRSRKARDRPATEPGFRPGGDGTRCCRNGGVQRGQQQAKRRHMSLPLIAAAAEPRSPGYRSMSTGIPSIAEMSAEARSNSRSDSRRRARATAISSPISATG